MVRYNGSATWVALVGVLVVIAAVVVLPACYEPGTDEQLLRVRQWEDHRLAEIDSLNLLLVHGGSAVRVEAARALGRIGDVQGRPMLERALQDQRPEVRAEVAFALGILGDPSASGPLIRQLPDETDPRALGEMALALGRLQPTTAGTAQVVSTLLERNHPYVREQALESLALLADSTSIDAMLEATHDDQSSVVWRAAYAMEKLPSETDRSVPRLRELTRHPDSLVKRYAVRSLGRLEASEALDTVTQTLVKADSDWQLRVMAADALGRLGNENAIDPLVTAAQDSVFHVRAAALQALGRIGDEKATGSIRLHTADPVVDVRMAAYDALASCTEPAALVSNLRTGLTDPSLLVVGTVLARLGDSDDPAAVPTLVRAAQDRGHESIRHRAVEGLANCQEQAPRPLLRNLLEDDNWIVATVAAQALGQLNDTDSAEALLSVLNRPTAHGDLRLEVVSTLGILKVPAAVVPLQKILEGNGDVRLRLAARTALLNLLPEADASALADEDEIRARLTKVERSPEQPAIVTASNALQLVLDTSRGRIYIDLLGREAPQTVESFARLAEAGFFRDVTFHRVVPNFVIQGGDPTGTGWGDPGYTIRSEWTRERYDRGVVGVAHSGKDTGGCQLFITHAPQPHLNARYTIFGKVAHGMDVVDAIQMGDTFSAEVRWANP